jgi:hydroxyacylglutathione hydrolase
MTPAMSGKMYDSILTRLLPLGEGVIVCPAHGAGSVCGGKISEREISTIGIEKATNPMLKLSRKEFVAYKAAEKHQTPPYFKKMEVYNLEGPPALGCLPSPCALKPSEFREKVKEGAFIVDVRSPAAFGGAHIKGSFSLPPSRLSNAGWVLTYDRPILLVAESPEALDFAVRNLVRLGFDRLEGYLAGGLEAWYKEGLPMANVELITVQDLRRRIVSEERITIVDVRRESEWVEGHIEGSKHIYLGLLEKQAHKLPSHSPVVVICKTGNRSSFGASVLLRAGFERVCNCLGGIDAWVSSDYPLVK